MWDRYWERVFLHSYPQVGLLTFAGGLQKWLMVLDWSFSHCGNGVVRLVELHRLTQVSGLPPLCGLTSWCLGSVVIVDGGPPLVRILPPGFHLVGGLRRPAGSSLLGLQGGLVRVRCVRPLGQVFFSLESPRVTLTQSQSTFVEGGSASRVGQEVGPCVCKSEGTFRDGCNNPQWFHIFGHLATREPFVGHTWWPRGAATVVPLEDTAAWAWRSCLGMDCSVMVRACDSARGDPLVGIMIAVGRPWEGCHLCSSTSCHARPGGAWSSCEVVVEAALVLLLALGLVARRYTHGTATDPLAEFGHIESRGPSAKCGRARVHDNSRRCSCYSTIP